MTRWTAIGLLLAAAVCAPAKTFFLTVAGLGGESDYEQRFQSWAAELDKIVRSSSPDAVVYTLAGKEATRRNLEARIHEIARQASPEDLVTVTLIGHGSFDGETYKFNLPGPDVSAEELAAWMDRIPARRQLLVNTTSASGGSVAALRRPGRVIVSATRRGTEKNATVFPRYWVEALQTGAADTDKNESVSALEAFQFAAAKTAQCYESQNRLATEHPVLEDTGSGDGVREFPPGSSAGVQARQFTLLRLGAAQRAMNDPAKRRLLEQREALERKIDALKLEKAAMPAAVYRQQMTKLLLELAALQEELDR